MKRKDFDKGLLSFATKRPHIRFFRNRFLRFPSLHVLRFLLAFFLFSSLVFAFWPMQGFNYRRVGFSSKPGPVRADLKWYYDFGYWSTHAVRLQDNASPVIGPDHTIYQITEHYLFALRPDGTQKWRANVSGRLAPAVSPDGTTIYASTSIFGDITALNTADGSAAWTYAYPGDASYSSLAVDDDGTIYIGTRLPASVYALNPNGTLKWSFTYPDSSLIGIEAPPAVGPDGSVYCVVNTVGLVALDNNGTFQWSNGDNCGSYGWPTPCVLTDGTIIIAGDMDSAGIIAYNPDGTKKWERLDIGGPGGYFPGVAVSEHKGIVYTARTGGKMYALDAQDGTTKWSTTVTSGENLDGSPALASNGVLYMMGTAGFLYAIRELDGTLLWQYELNMSSFYWGPQSPALGPDGTLYAVAPGTPPASGNLQARLYAFKSKDDLVGTWDSQGVYYRNSDTGGWVKTASPATMIASGDLDGDAIDDLLGLWPSQGGIWVKYSETGIWARLSSTAQHIGAGDMNGDGRVDLLGTWDGQGVYYRDSMTGGWVKMATPATMVTSGDLDEDGMDDLIGIWPGQGGVWVKYSSTSAWERLSSTARDITSGDMNGDGRDDLVGTWDGQGVYYRNTASGAWVKIATPADQVSCGYIDVDGIEDLLGIWPSQGGVWVKYSETGEWERLSSTAQNICVGMMREPESSGASRIMELALPIGGWTAGPEGALGQRYRAMDGPGGWRFAFQEEKNLVPIENHNRRIGRTSGPGEPGFICPEQGNLFPQETPKKENKPPVDKKIRKKY